MLKINRSDDESPFSKETNWTKDKIKIDCSFDIHR